MNEKEISELKKALSQDRNTIGKIYGCYVNSTGEIISEFEESTSLMTEDENEKYLAIFRRTLSGTNEKNLIAIPFSNEQVLNGEEHKLLTELRKSELSNEEARKTLFSKIASSYKSKENYVILLGSDKYDVPFRGKDGGEDISGEVFSFIICSICPVKLTKPVLSYDPDKKTFVNNVGNNVISSADIGFVFPSFDDRKANIYSTLFYTKDSGNEHATFSEAVFGSGMKMSAKAQSTVFKTVLADSLEKECSFDVAKGVHRQICECIEEHKQSKEPEPLSISKYQFKDILQNCGVKEEKLEKFTEEYTKSFGQNTELPPKNVIDARKFELKTPDVVIKVAKDKTDLVQTKVIDGVKYIMIRADEGVELNGLNVTIDGENE